MQILSNYEKIVSQFQRKRELLKAISRATYPVNKNVFAIHKRRLENAKIFLDELEEVEMLLISGVPMKMVPRPTFEKQIKKADFATIEFDGQFCQIAIIQNFLSEGIWLIHTASIREL